MKEQIHRAMQMCNGTWQGAQPVREHMVIAGLCSSPAKTPLWSFLCSLTGTFLASRREGEEAREWEQESSREWACERKLLQVCGVPEQWKGFKVPPWPVYSSQHLEESRPITSCRQCLKADICPSNSTGNPSWRQHSAHSPLDLIQEDSSLPWNCLGSGPRLKALWVANKTDHLMHIFAWISA